MNDGLFIYKRNEPISMLGMAVVPQKKDDKNGIYGNTPQDAYMNRMHAACLELVNDIFHDKKGFNDILKKAGELRQKIALDFKVPEANNFGKLRTPNRFNDRISTPLIEQYSSMKAALLELDQDDSTITWELYSKKEEKGFRSGCRVGTCSDGTQVNLSKYFFSTDEKSTPSDVIAHTYPENLTKALNECAFLFQEILRFDNKKVADLDLIQQYIARFHWWFAQTTPYFRGSAACAELIVSALAFGKLGKYFEWQEGVYVDRIALVSSLETCLANYSSLHQ